MNLNFFLIFGSYSFNSGDFRDHLFQISNYSSRLDTFLGAYPKESLLVVNGDKLIRDPYSEIKKIENFLGLKRFIREDHFFFREGSKFPCFKVPKVRCMEKDKGLQHPKLKKETVAYLTSNFQPMVDDIRKRVGINISLSCQ